MLNLSAYRYLSAAFLAAVLAVGCIPATGRAELATSFSLSENGDEASFLPMLEPSDWELSKGKWLWRSDALLSSSRRTSIALYQPQQFEFGIIGSRVKLLTAPRGKKPNASLLFAYQSATAYRYVTIEAAGRRSRIKIGQKGTVDGSDQMVVGKKVRVPKKKWIDLIVEVEPTGDVRVYINGTLKMTALLPIPVEGSVGLKSARSKDRFAGFRIDPFVTAQSCPTCHSGGSKHRPAPDVMTYWSDSRGGAHGNPGGKPALTCTGAGGCHDLLQPSASAHHNGTLETVDNPTENTAHLKAEFIETSPDGAWSVAEKFNNTCVSSCHSDQNVKTCDFGSKFITPRFGKDADGSNGARMVPYWVDSDISTHARRQNPDYALCVSCHDPHGTGVVVPGRSSNYMFRGEDWFNAGEHCNICHL